MIYTTEMESPMALSIKVFRRTPFTRSSVVWDSPRPNCQDQHARRRERCHGERSAHLGPLAGHSAGLLLTFSLQGFLSGWIRCRFAIGADGVPYLL